MVIAPEVIQRAKARVGTVLNGKWRLERLLGIGGMAAVYEAVHRNQNRIAIKMLHPELSLDENVKTRFLREGYVANTVGHVGAVAVYDDDVSEDGAAFLVMELLQGETLEDRAERKGGKLLPGEVLELTNALLDVLGAAHERGIVHRDIKPDNLFLTTSGQLKVLDFGIARLREIASSANTRTTTGAGTFMGTPAFMSPEQARGRWHELDVRSDIWSVGATMFTLLSGYNVHEAETITDQLVLAATAKAPTLASVAPALPAILVDLVDRALAYDKSERWPTAEVMQVVLRDVLKLVAPTVSLSAPRISLSVLERDSQADTLAAPLAAIPSQMRASRPGSLVSAVTSAGSSSSSDDKRRSPFGIAALGALLAGIVFATVWVVRTPEKAADSSVSLHAALPRTALRVAALSARPVAPPPPAREARDEPALAPPKLALHSAADEAANRSDAGRAPVPAFTGRTNVRLLRSNPQVAPPVTKPTTLPDPFEKRY